MGRKDEPDPWSHRFGKLVKNLRRVRRMTQEQIAERSGLAADTIRRAEHGDFSPSLKTIGKLARGLDLDLSTLFSAYDLRELDIGRELTTIVQRRMSKAERLAALRVLSYLLEVIRTVDAEDDGDERG